MQEQLKGKKILFATSPVDGHINPLTALAKHLQQQGCDVRWYTSSIYIPKMKRLGIVHYRPIHALEVNAENIDVLFPERKKMTDPAQKFNFDMTFMAERGPEWLKDIRQIYGNFRFDIMISDSTFSAIPLVRSILKIPVLSIGVGPLAEDSVNLAPYGMALPPAQDGVVQAEYAKFQDFNRNVQFRESIDMYGSILNHYGISHKRALILDVLVRQASLHLQIGVPGFEYQRSDLGENVRFLGALLPWSAQERQPWYDERLREYRKVLLVTQGTVEKDTRKLLEPTLDVFRNSDTLVIATTGGVGTKQLQQRYCSRNIIIEDYLPFAEVMPHVHVYVTNGGYGGVLHGLQHKLPIVAAGLYECKNEVCARIGYFNYGINLNTEHPEPQAIYNAVEEVFANPKYKDNVARLGEEMNDYRPVELCEQYITRLLN